MVAVRYSYPNINLVKILLTHPYLRIRQANYFGQTAFSEAKSEEVKELTLPWIFILTITTLFIRQRSISKHCTVFH